ncbi:DUF2860 domain-containing protein [Alginatibacterium sediminis]|nr:DUF2860 domain-containing protein [Alginatibacterium sediminis]
MKTVVLPLVVIGLSSSLVNARPLAQEPGWDVTLGLNVGVVQSSSQFSTDDDNATISDLEQDPKSSSSAIVYPLGRISYTFESMQDQLFFGNSAENVGRGQFQYELGYTRKLGENSRVTAALFPSLPFANETWQDPYLTNSARSKTEENYLGGRVAWDFIAESPVSLKYAYAKRDIEQERSGAGLSSAQQSSLNRNADIHRFAASVFVPLSKQWFVEPRLSYTQTKADGTAMSSDDWELSANAVYRHQAHIVSANLGYGQRKYDGSNPVFDGRTQEDKHWNLFAIYAYKEPFSWKDVSFNALAGYTNNDANISFYDSKALVASLGLSYTF